MLGSGHWSEEVLLGAIFLSPTAKEILERQPKKSAFIFPFRGDPTRHANSETITKWLRENGFKG